MPNELKWEENEDGEKTTTYEGVKITIFENTDGWMYYLDDDESDAWGGYESEEEAIAEAMSEIRLNG
jgi:hypothetical protein